MTLIGKQRLVPCLLATLVAVWIPVFHTLAAQ